MRGTVRKVFITLVAVLALLGVGLVVFGSKPAPVQAANPPAPLPQKPDNTQCLGCHSAPGKVYQFPNGDTISISVDPQVFDTSIHANVACQTCHANISGYPHPEKTAKTAREFTLQFKDTCTQCHPTQMKQLDDSAHTKLAKEGNPNTPICASCHMPHTQQPIKKNASGEPAPSEHAAIANICSKCHGAIVDQYKNSVHGAGVFVEHNQDVPACDDCHGIHTISNARASEFRLNSPQMCANCHSRSDIMSKYGISTNVLQTYVADFHGTTVTLFSKEKTGSETNKPVCYDCHGVHNISKVNDPKTGLEIQQNLLVTCQKCHPDANLNFPASWMSHYNASPSKFPLVYYVNLFYMIFIPAVLGGMGLFVLSDILRRLGITGRKPGSAASHKE